MSNLQITIIMAVILFGCMAVVNIARRSNTPWRFKTFFLGGADIGPDLTEHNTLGITFAWSGGIWFFAWIAYNSGPWVIVSQIFWIFSLIWLSRLVPKIIPQVRDKTIHGFIGDHYGISAQRLAAITTTVGYVLNCGFELYWSSLLFCQCIGHPEFTLLVAIGLSVVVGMYCTIGGFDASVRVDKAQNMFGVLGLSILVLLLPLSLNLSGPLLYSCFAFAAGSIFFFFMVLASYYKRLQVPSRSATLLAALYALGACLIVLYLIFAPPTDGQAAALVKNTPVPWYMIVGTLTFQVFFNVVDMQNWQQIAANGDATKSEQKEVSQGIARGALYLMWFPALGGILLGCCMRAIGPELLQASIFTEVANHTIPHSNDLLRGALFGLIFFGLICTSLSTGDSLLMSGVQTLWYDLIRLKTIRGILRLPESDERILQEKKIIDSAVASLIPISVAMVVIFYFLYQAYSDNVFNFQALIYAVPLSLLWPVLYGLNPNSKSKGNAFLAILAPLVALSAMLAAALLWSKELGADVVNWDYALMPVVGNLLSFAVMKLTAKRILERAN